MGLNVETPKGQQAILDAEDAIDIWHRNNPQIRFIFTPQNKPAVVDGCLYVGETLFGIGEIKCRYDMDTYELKCQRRNEWLVTYSKVTRSARLAEALGVPLWGFLYLHADKTLFVIVITNSNGVITCDLRMEETKTKNNINKEKDVIRENAFILMDKAMTYRM